MELLLNVRQKSVVSKCWLNFEGESLVNDGRIGFGRFADRTARSLNCTGPLDTVTIYDKPLGINF